MKILGIETSGYCGSVALTDGDELLGECLVNSGPRHSERLMIMVDRLIGELGIGKSEIDAVSVSTGPGSFTSLRIGMGIAKGMVYSLGIKISGVSSLETLSASVSGCGSDICALTDARRGEVYCNIYRGDANTPHSAGEERILPVDELCTMIKNETVFIGDGAKMYRDRIKDNLGSICFFAPSVLNLPRASLMCSLSYEKLKNGFEDNVFSLTPNYIRKSSAEVNSKNI